MPSLSLSRRIGSWRRPENEGEEIVSQRKLHKITVVEKQRRNNPLFVEDDDDDDDDEDHVPPQEDHAFKLVEHFGHYLAEAMHFAERKHSIIKLDYNEAQGWGKRAMCCASSGGSFDDISVVTATKASEPLFIKVVPGDPVKLQQQSWDIVRQNTYTDDNKNKVKGRSMRPKIVEIFCEPPDSNLEREISESEEECAEVSQEEGSSTSEFSNEEQKE
jgi:hypothetical protein